MTRLEISKSDLVSTLWSFVSIQVFMYSDLVISAMPLSSTNPTFTCQVVYSQMEKLKIPVIDKPKSQIQQQKYDSNIKD